MTQHDRPMLAGAVVAGDPAGPEFTRVIAATKGLRATTAIASPGSVMFSQLRKFRFYRLASDDSACPRWSVMLLQLCNFRLCRRPHHRPGLAGLRAVVAGELQSLDLSGCHKITDKGLQALSSLASLQSLSLRWYWSVPQHNQ